MSFHNFKAEMVKRNLSYLELSFKLNITENELLEKINRKQQFHLNEIEIIREMFPNIKLEVLFE